MNCASDVYGVHTDGSTNLFIAQLFCHLCAVHALFPIYKPLMI